GELERAADAVGQFSIAAVEDLIEQWLCLVELLAVQKQEGKLRGSEQIAGRRRVQHLKLPLGFFALLQGEQLVGVLAPEFHVVGVQRQRALKFVRVRIAVREKLAGALGDTRRLASRSCEQQNSRVVFAAQHFRDAPQIEHQAALGRPQLPGLLIMLGGERELVALLGEGCQLDLRAEIAGIGCERLLPALDSGRERLVNILKGLLSGAVAGLANAVKDAARQGLLFGFEAQERV